MSAMSSMMSGDGSMYDSTFMQKFKSQYSHHSDLRGSFASQIPGASTSQGDSKGGASGKSSYVLNLHFLGLSDMPKAGWFERAPGYELIVHAGGVAKRIRPRIPAPPAGLGAESIDLEDLLSAAQLKVLQRIDDRASVRCAAPGEFFRVDVWEERTALVDIGGKGATRVMLGQCYVPLDHKYNRRPCTWPIVERGDKALAEIGFLTCKYGLATMPAPVQNLCIVEGSVGSTEVQLAWEPPESDGGTALRGYRVEARLPGARAAADSSSLLAGLGPIGDETARTASAPAVAEPSVVLRNLTGNTEYVFCIWAVSEAGPGLGSEVHGKTGAVVPAECGTPSLIETGEGHFIQWQPPEDSGGADVIAYRVWLRPLFHNSEGDIWPAEGWLDLGLSEHRGDQMALQQTPLRYEALPPCSGCLCSLSALNSAGLVGPSTLEVPLATADGSRFTAQRFRIHSEIPRADGRNVSSPPSHASAPASAPPGRHDPLAQYHAPGEMARNQLRGGGATPASPVTESRSLNVARTSLSPPRPQDVASPLANVETSSRLIARVGGPEASASGNDQWLSAAPTQATAQAQTPAHSADSMSSWISPNNVPLGVTRPVQPDERVMHGGSHEWRVQLQEQVADRIINPCEIRRLPQQPRSGSLDSRVAGRVVDPSEIRRLPQQPRSGSADSRVAMSSLPQRTSWREEPLQSQGIAAAYGVDPAGRLQSSNLHGSEGLAAAPGLNPTGRLQSSFHGSEGLAVAPGLSPTGCLQKDSQSGSFRASAGSWALGQKGSLMAGRQGFELR